MDCCPPAPSFIPARPQRELREVTRYRTPLVNERAHEVNRLQQVLDGANSQLASGATDIDLLGKSGHDILAALVGGSSDAAALAQLVGGSSDAAALAQLARGRLREKLPQLEQARAGQFSAHQRFLIARAAGPYRLPGRQSGAGQRRDRGAPAPF